MPTLQTFHSFPLLPLELRLRIWTFAIFTPQLISLVAYTEEETSSLLPSTSSPSSKTSQTRMYTYLERCSSLSIAKPHPLLHTNAESRGLLLSTHYLLPYYPEAEVFQLIKSTPIQPSPPNPDLNPQLNTLKVLEPTKLHNLNHTLLTSIKKPQTLFSPTTTILFLADPPSHAPTTYYTSLSVLPRWLPTSLLSSIRYLVLSYYTWRKDRKFHLLQILYSFSSLERLYVCFVGSGTEWKGKGRGEGGGWLDAVRRDANDMDGMVRQVEREVLGDVEELDRKAGGKWKRPVVKVVRDRRAAVKNWEGSE
jgi:hypothetical protein